MIVLEMCVNLRVEEDSIVVINVLFNISIEAVLQSYQDGRFSFLQKCLESRLLLSDHSH